MLTHRQLAMALDETISQLNACVVEAQKRGLIVTVLMVEAGGQEVRFPLKLDHVAKIESLLSETP